jgi:hypothetical protein
MYICISYKVSSLGEWSSASHSMSWVKVVCRPFDVYTCLCNMCCPPLLYSSFLLAFHLSYYPVRLSGYACAVSLRARSNRVGMRVEGLQTLWTTAAATSALQVHRTDINGATEARRQTEEVCCLPARLVQVQRRSAALKHAPAST